MCIKILDLGCAIIGMNAPTCCAEIRKVINECVQIGQGRHSIVYPLVKKYL